MEIGLELKQKMTMSPQMQQSLSILQCNIQELQEFLVQESMENPMIDMVEPQEHMTKDEELNAKLEWLRNADEQNRVYYSQEYEASDREYDVLSRIPDKGEGLEEFLFSQLLDKRLTKAETAVLKWLICCLDENGYLVVTKIEVAKQFRISEEDAERSIELIKSLEPAGIGAFSLDECLMLQLSRQNLLDDIYERLICSYMTEISKRQHDKIGRELKIATEEVTMRVNVIKSLNPKPGSIYSARDTLKYITPDVIVVKLEGYFEIILNDYTCPGLRINPYYCSLLKQDCDKETKDYIKTKVMRAEWLQNCITQRNTTLVTVMKIVVDWQKAFFENKGELRPMSLKDVGTAAGIHESTVSRALAGKYLQCNWGVYPLQYFLVRGFMEDEEQTSVNVIKTKIRSIIDGENKAKPFSDQKLTDILLKDNISISRRTVAKYRDSMEILDASGRKK